MTEKVDYTLYYWPVPFRGHFLRAILTYAGASWTEGEDIPAFMQKTSAEQPIPFMGPPFLIDHEAGDFALSQMPAIALYLGEQLGLIPDDATSRATTVKIVADANDLIDELTLQGGREMWTAEKWQAFLPRFKKWMSFWEAELAASKTGLLLDTEDLTVADIVSATLWMTMAERFEDIYQLLKEEAPLTLAYAHEIWQLPVFQKFSTDTISKYGNSYCGGQIEESLRKVIK
ncbi:glutathione S-transferase family protein [Lactococcus termiticola]|uniref:GST N-terminal domain-containing protein n=1 Tax=Lactococcus termiticola TaxID=2169526 RepID=A0A2R5HEY3_9LACT|nr:glutathione S-transferase [Lactococcus termiticola]GBG96624.1 hypothetical protein NtB2_00748 [Lactococcus termiticola]